MSANAHEAVEEFPEFITEARGETCIKVKQYVFKIQTYLLLQWKLGFDKQVFNV